MHLTAHRLCVVEVVEPGEGGVFRHVEGLVDHLLSHGVRVHLAYSDRRGSRSLFALIARVKAAGGETVNLGVANAPEFRDIRAFWRLVRFVRRVRPDIVHGHSSKAGVLARGLALFIRKPAYLYTSHAYYGMSGESFKMRFLYNPVERILGRIGTTINISKAEAEFGRKVLHIRPERSRIIPNPVDTVRFRPPTTEEKQEARVALGLQPGEVAVGMVARMCWQKDPETAYAAFLKIAQRWPQVKFLHLGWGLWGDYLMGKAKEAGMENRVRIIGYMEDPRQFYQGIDGLLSSSRYEAGWPFVVLEAMACGLPVIATTCPGMQDFGDMGLSDVYTFEPGRVEQGAAQLERWLGRLSQGSAPNNHREYVERTFSPDACFGPVLSLYETLR